ncbi:MAG: hypothetical protein JEZ02_04870 [Desulfatibacillum sp.]|nr:hypothetical protein [Desulfatibacillum sp.]
MRRRGMGFSDTFSERLDLLDRSDRDESGPLLLSLLAGSILGVNLCR